MRPAALLLPLTLIAAIGVPARSSIEGLWKNPAGTAIIRIAPCSMALCGKVVWASELGKREAAKSASNVVGSTVLTNVVRNGNQWNGRLFIPDDDIHVSARLELVDARQLMLAGCAFAGLFCRSQVWTRVEGPLPTSR